MKRLPIPEIAFIVLMSIFILFVMDFCGKAHASQMDLSRAVIHHTDSHDVSAKEIDRWHKERGWDGIGYHFIIRKDGSIEKGRSLNKKGAHAKGRNHYVGIALTGRDEFTNEQKKSLQNLINDLGIKHIERHHENCPGKGLDLDKFKKTGTSSLISSVPVKY